MLHPSVDKVLQERSSWRAQWCPGLHGYFGVLGQEEPGSSFPSHHHHHHHPLHGSGVGGFGLSPTSSPPLGSVTSSSPSIPPLSGLGSSPAVSNDCISVYRLVHRNEYSTSATESKQFSSVGMSAEGASHRGARACYFAHSSGSPYSSNRNCYQVGHWRAGLSQALTCMEWYPHGYSGELGKEDMLIAAGSSLGAVNLIRFNPDHQRPWHVGDSYLVGEIASKQPRLCLGISWNPILKSQVAAGFDKSRGDYCLVIHDLEGGGESGAMGSGSGGTLASSAHKLSYTEGVSALSWLPGQANVLAAGSTSRWLRLYDTRAGGNPQANASAHTRAVLGISVTPLRPHLLATWSDASSDPVHVWDARKLPASGGGGSGGGPIVALPPRSSFRDSSSFSTGQAMGLGYVSVAWSPVEGDILATLSGGDDCIHVWDVMQSRGRKRPQPIDAHYLDVKGIRGGDDEGGRSPQSPKSGLLLTNISWQNSDAKCAGTARHRTAGKDCTNNIVCKAFISRVLVGYRGVGAVELGIHASAPVAVSPLGDVLWAAGSVVFEVESDGASTSKVRPDASTMIRQRAIGGYGMSINANLDVLKREQSEDSRSLELTWEWVARVESLFGGGEPQIGAHWLNEPQGRPPQCAMSLIGNDWMVNECLRDSGIRSLFAAGSGEERNWVLEPLNCRIYSSLGRRCALFACGWLSVEGGDEKKKDDTSGQTADQGDSTLADTQGLVGLENMMSISEAQGDYERSAALAVFCCDLRAAMEALDRGLQATEGVCSNALQSDHEAAMPDGQQQQTKSNQLGRISSESDVLRRMTALSDGGRLERIPTVEAEFETDSVDLFTHVSGGSPSRLESESLNKITGVSQQLRSTLTLLPETAELGSTTGVHSSATQLGSAPGVHSFAAQPERRAALQKNGSPALYHLVSMCIAGFGRGGDDPRSALWRSACEGLLNSPELKGPGHAYLRAACSFLFAVSEQSRADFHTAPPIEGILGDPDLSLADRTALACLYLSPEDFDAFIQAQVKFCISNAALDGLLLVGLGLEGMDLLKRYIEATGDVQTPALLTSRLLGENANSTNSSASAAATAASAANLSPTNTLAYAQCTNEWVEAYRNLLNRWRLWHERARFDVARADFKTERLGAPPRAPAHMFIQCTFCNLALPLSSLRHQPRVGSSWLSRQKPILACCPACRKPLPRCYVCLSHLGCLNPYSEIQRNRHLLKDQQTGGGPAVAPLANLAAVQFSEWFTFCQRCKHGGHAHHISQWFVSHSECGVSGCDCLCYFQDAGREGGNQ